MYHLGVNDAGATYERVVDLLYEWDPRGSARPGCGFPERLRDYLDSKLNPSTRSPWDRDIVEVRHGPYSVDVAVNGVIGIVLTSGSHSGEIQRIRQFIKLYARNHEYLVVFVYGTGADTKQRWRTFEWKYTANYLHVDDIAYIHTQEAALPFEESDPSPAVRPHALVMVVVGILLSLGMVVFAPTTLGLTVAVLVLFVSLGLGAFLHYVSGVVEAKSRTATEQSVQARR